MWKIAALAVLIAVVVSFAGYQLFLTEDFRPAELLKGKCVLISGASSGIGEQVAYEYSRWGSRLLLTARRGKLLQEVAKRCKDLGAAQVEILAGDMTSEAHRKKLLKAAEKTLQCGGKLDHLVLSHGEYDAKIWTGSAQNLTDLERTMEIHFYSYVEMVSTALPLLSRGDQKGHIGVVSALDGKIPRPLMAGLDAAWTAQQNFFNSLRLELQFKNSNVSITTFALGFIATERATEMTTMHFPSLKSFLAASPQDAARTIIQGVSLRNDDVIYPMFAYFQYLFFKFLPEIYEYNLNYATLLRNQLRASS